MSVIKALAKTDTPSTNTHTKAKFAKDNLISCFFKTSISRHPTVHKMLKH